MSDTYSVVLTGKLIDGFDQKGVQASFSELFKLSQEKVQAYFNGKPKVVKKDADHQTATRYKARLERIGASVELRPEITKLELPAKSSEKPTRAVTQKPTQTAAQTKTQKPTQTVTQKITQTTAQTVTQKPKFKRAAVKAKTTFNDIELENCVNAIDFGRKIQISKMQAIEIVDEPRSRWPILIGFSCIGYACADFALDYLGIMEISGALWLPITAALIGAVALWSSAEN